MFSDSGSCTTLVDRDLLPLLDGGDRMGKGSSKGLVPGSFLAHDNGNSWPSSDPLILQSRSGLTVAMGGIMCGIGVDEEAPYGGERFIELEPELRRGLGLGLDLDFFERAIT